MPGSAHAERRAVALPEGNLSKGMRQLNGVYTQRFVDNLRGMMPRDRDLSQNPPHPRADRCPSH